MGTTILDRIRAERTARQLTRESILRSGTLPGGQGASGRGDHEVVGSFVKQVVPAIGKAVSGEVTSALEKVRQELVGCLAREFGRMASIAPGLSSAPREPEPPAPEEERRPPAADEEKGDAEQVETDLDLAAEEVARGIEMVLGESVPKAEPPPATPAELEGEGTEDLTPVSLVAASAPVWTPAPDPEEEAVAPARTSPRPEAAARGPDAPVAAIIDEVREALIPGIADGISQFVSDIETSQERIAQELTTLGRQVAELETKVRDFTAAAGRPAPPAEPAAAAGGTGSERGMLQILREMEDRLARRIDAISSFLFGDRHP